MTDLVVLVASVTVARLGRFGLENDAKAGGGSVQVSYTVAGILIAVAWWLCLQIYRTRSITILGYGLDEYRRVTQATFAAFGGFAILAVALKIDSSRAYLAIAFPLGLAALVVSRKIARVCVRSHRARSGEIDRVLVIGTLSSASQLHTWFSKHGQSGFELVGAWNPSDSIETTHLDLSDGSVAVLGREHDLRSAVEITRPSAVIVTNAETLGQQALQDITWMLSELSIDLLLSPNVLGVSGARLHLRDIGGMPLLHMEEPQYEGASRFAKVVFDRVGATLLFIVFSPVMLVFATLIKLTSRGPVFYVQERIGRNGQPFGMVKFRSMREGADAELVELLEAEGRSLSELPKLDRDPRVTPIGGFIRRYSIDELPQLLNVIRGQMSLVGPRPQRAFEVDQYDRHASRRLTVRPGMTGLWQVSGRSDISWEEAIRMDVFYVENWSMIADLIILWKTVRAVVLSDGAY